MNTHHGQHRKMLSLHLCVGYRVLITRRCWWCYRWCVPFSLYLMSSLADGLKNFCINTSCMKDTKCFHQEQWAHFQIRWDAYENC